MKKNCFLFIILFLLLISSVNAEKNHNLFSIDLEDVDIHAALHILAKFCHYNIVISPQVGGNTALYLKQVTCDEAIRVMLTTHNLVKIQIGSTRFICSREELTKHVEENSKSRLLREETDPLVTQIWQIRYAKADDITRLLEENSGSLLSKRGHIKADLRTNTVCIQDTDTRLIAIKKIVKQLDVPVEQVLIEARLMSIDQDFERQLGIHFALNANTGEHNSEKYSLAIAHLANTQLDVQLAALEKQGHGEIISAPSLFTSNQQPAMIESGEEIPYQEVSEGGGTAISFKKAVLSLKVIPQILPDQKVLLQLEVHQDRPNSRVVLGVPAITTRQMSTHILVKHGQTIVLGGIYETNEEQTTQRVPFLGKIPLVGLLFRQQNVKDNKRELLIFVTPKIISFSKRNKDLNGFS